MGKWLYRLGQVIWCWTPMGFEIAIQTDILEKLEQIEKKLK